jgi:ABC-type polysaccharide/polyol phosphate export permease
VKYLFEVLLTVWMFASAVVYPLDAVGGRLGQLIRLNPMTVIVEAYRQILLGGVSPDQSLLVVAAATSILLPAAWLAFHRAEFQFAENI